MRRRTYIGALAAAGVSLGGEGGPTEFSLAIEDGELRIVSGRLL